MILPLLLLMQAVPVLSGAGVPPSSCGSPGQLWLNTSTGAISRCDGAAYVPITGDQTVTLTGNVTGTGTGTLATTIANNAVTYARMQDVSATARVLGRIAAGAGDPEELTSANLQSILGLASARVTADRTTTATGLANVTDLAVSVAASEVWTCEVYITGGCNNTGGSQFAIDFPASATSQRVTWQGNTTGVTAVTGGTVTADDTASVTFFTVNLAGQQVRGAVTLVNGANAGAIQVRFKSVTNGQTTTVSANSYMTCRRL